MRDNPQPFQMVTYSAHPDMARLDPVLNTSPLGLRIGIHSGYATIGSIRPDSRKSFTAVGATVNIASRLEKLCTPGGILIGHETRTGVCSEFECIPCEDVVIRGLSRNINVYDVKMPKGRFDTIPPGH